MRWPLVWRSTYLRCKARCEEMGTEIETLTDDLHSTNAAWSTTITELDNVLRNQNEYSEVVEITKAELKQAQEISKHNYDQLIIANKATERGNQEIIALKAQVKGLLDANHRLHAETVELANELEQAEKTIERMERE